MSIVHDQIRRLDLQIDKFQLSSAASKNISTISADAASTAENQTQSGRAVRLKTIIRSLSTTSTSRPQLPQDRLLRLIDQAQERSHGEQQVQGTKNEAEEDLEWLIAAKATVQTYGLVMQTLLNQLTPLTEEIWYWDDILSSYTNTGIYTVQTAPVRLLGQAKEVWADVQNHYRSQQTNSTASVQRSVSDRWRRFYGLVQQSVSERSLAHARTTVLSPFALCRSEAQRKQNGLKKLREMSSCGLGLLVDEGLAFGSNETSLSIEMETDYMSKDDWRSTVGKSIILMEGILTNVYSLDTSLGDFEETVFARVDEESEALGAQSSNDGGSKGLVLIKRLKALLEHQLPTQSKSSDAAVLQYGRPTVFVRYWLPGVILILSGSTLLRIVANRQAEIITWIQEFGSTIRDFWLNWVIEPVKKLIGTIRHDEASEVAIMSKDSLQADRASLERMVVDFAADHPNETGSTYTEADLTEIRAKVKEGDLTPVLRAYERDLRKPFMGTVRGDLIRALLIQVQKTKVDVEVAIGGIDSLLKSQELVFGLVGLTPGILISFAVFRWLGSAFGSRKGGRMHKQQGETVRTLRNIDRILNASTLTEDGMLSYKDHGMLICEVHNLRQKAASLLPARVHRDFLEDVNELVDVKVGVHRQGKAVERIRWAYGKWLR